MATTITIDEHLLAEAEQVAARTGRTLTTLIEDALREVLPRFEAEARKKPIPLPTFSGGGLQPGVDLNNNAALRDLMDESDAAPRR